MQEKRKREYSKKEIQLSHVEKWRKSGLSMSSYAREAGISASNLSKWAQPKNKAMDKFKPLSLPTLAPGNQNHFIEIIVNNQIKIRLPNDQDLSKLINLVRSLMQCN
jgi:hypothetical protein